jgi:hypothetical protein
VRRSNLIAFALGATSVLLSGFVALSLRDAGEMPTQSYLTVHAPDVIPEGSGTDNLNSVSYAAGNVIRDCGATGFEVEVGDPHGFTYQIAITEENSAPLQCIVNEVRAVDASISLGLKVA